MVEGTRGIDFLFGVIIAVVASNWIAQHVHSEGVYESELERDSSVYFLLQEPPHALRPHTAATVSRRISPVLYSLKHDASAKPTAAVLYPLLSSAFHKVPID